jgi:3-deoxy-7-phosphoheptulonate synthase
MVVVLREDASAEERQAVSAVLSDAGIAAVAVRWAEHDLYIPKAPLAPELQRTLTALPAVERCVAVTSPYVLASRELHPEKSLVRVGHVVFGGAAPVLIAGPCSVEDEAQINEAAEAAAAAGAQMLRGGAFKPRTSPYSFQGLGLEGIRLLAAAGARAGLPIVTEVMEPAMADVIAEHADMLQVGSRNMQNFPLLRAVGRTGRPVLLKRGFAATLDEWLLAAEYILAEGNAHVVLCERGIRGFDTHTRNVLDLACVPLLARLTHLPVIVDPSHATGHRDLVLPMGVAAIAAGADGLIVEMHPHPDAALSDADQTIDPATLRALVTQAQSVRAALLATRTPDQPEEYPTKTPQPAAWLS